MLAKNPGFTAVAVITLALGIGANTAIFSVVDAVLLKPLPYPHPERIVIVFEEPPSGGLNEVSTPDFLDWKRQSTVFATIAAEDWGTKTLTDAGVPVDLSSESVSANYFGIPGAKPLLGRTFAPDEDQPGKQYEVVLCHRIWRSLFGADPKIIGRSIRLNGMAYTVIGVMPSGLFDRWGTDVRIPLAFEPKDMARDYRWLHVWARLKPGVTLEQARQEMKVIAARIAHDDPQSNKGWSATVERYVDLRLDDSLQRSLYVLLAAAGAVLLIGCVNLANLSLSRGVGREREVAIRSALGAGRARLVRQLLTESIVLAGLGGTVGVAVGWALMLGLKAWRTFLPFAYRSRCSTRRARAAVCRNPNHPHRTSFRNRSGDSRHALGLGWVAQRRRSRRYVRRGTQATPACFGGCRGCLGVRPAVRGGAPDPQFLQTFAGQSWF